jgi:hypothetical protein
MNPGVISRQRSVVGAGRPWARSVLECGSPLPLWRARTTQQDVAEMDSSAAGQSARGLAQSQTGRSLAAALVLTLGLFTVTLLGEPLSGGQYSLQGGPATGGGGKSDGGTFAVTGGAGETATGPLTGGAFVVTGGLVGVAVVPDDVTPELTLTDTGEATLTWSAEATGYVLESSPSVGEFADWQPVTPAPAGTTFTTPFNQPLRFFRLRKP